MKLTHTAPLLSAALIALAFAASPSQAAILFADDFSGGTGDLAGTTPDTTTGAAAWVAPPTNFLADGTIGGTSAGTATLAFAPVDGLVYTLDASFTSITGDGNWIPFGFVNGQSASNSTSGVSENRFLENQTVGIAWMFARGDNSTNANTAFLGNDATNVGNSDGTSWSGGPTNGGNIDMRVVLDTTGGTGNWTATWFAKQDTDGSYTTVRGSTGLLDESITSVGFGKSSDAVSGTITSFSLNSIPEPSSAALLGLGGLALILRRRK